VIEVFVQDVDGWWCGVASIGEAILTTAVETTKEKTTNILLSKIPKDREFRIVEEGTSFTKKLTVTLKEAHLGEKEIFDFKLATQFFSTPVLKVLKAAAAIPMGFVTTYGNLAKAVKTSPRVVGRIMATNCIYPIVQCHRVVGSDFSLVGYGGKTQSQALQAKLDRLKNERQGKKQKTISVEGMEFQVYPIEVVLEKNR
jgi:methylated-DNA-[protein]-cysteine S-methyltransferase